MTSLRKRYRELLELRIEVAAAELEAFDKPAWQREPHVRFSTQWEREDYAREQRGEKPQGPWVTPRSCHDADAMMACKWCGEQR